ncbi:MAG TPA: zf-HC2 domain-containing protein [Acidimicrobiales bacterium]|nr:zf-HC2 domain-containing protein [Acidimicrobiales bacterium]
MLLRRRRPLVCQEVVELVTDYLEGTLPARDRARFEAHLADCPHCSRYLAQMRRTLDVLGRIEVDHVAPEAMDELITLYRRWQAD